MPGDRAGRLKASHRKSSGLRAAGALDVTFSKTGTNPDQETYGDVEELQHAIQSLPAGQRQAIELLKLQELSLKEASAASGQSVGALKVATHRAMTALRRAIGGDR